MEALNSAQFMSLLGRDSLQGGLLVLAVLLMQWLLGKRLAPRWRSSLWLLVMVRLLLVVSVGSVVSVFNLLPHTDQKPAAPLVAVTVPQVHTSEPSGPPPMLATASSPFAPPGSDAPDRSASMAATAAAPAASHPPVFHWSPSRILFCLWLAGVAGLTLYVAAGSLGIYRRMARLAPVTDRSLLELLDDCRECLGVTNRLSVVEGAEIGTPALCGFFRPRLLLPRGFARQFSGQQLRFILLHELAHVKRRDILLNWLAAALQIAHWFNPLIWLGFARWRADRELACDALALQAAGENQNQAYGETILRLLENFTQRTAMPGMVGILEDKKQLRERIKMIATIRAGSRLGLITMVLLAVLGVVCLTDAQLPGAKNARKSTAAGSAAAQSSREPEVRHGADPAPKLVLPGLTAQSLTVTVLDAATGGPLPEAEVVSPYTETGMEPHLLRRLTDKNGRYVLQFTKPPKEYRRQMSMFAVTANHEGYAGRSAAWTSSQGDVESSMPEAVTIKLERGAGIGGVVRDESGRPLAGVRVLLRGSDYRGFSLGTGEKKTHDYAEVEFSDPKHPAAVTDAAGRWTYASYPTDLEVVTVTFLRPDDSRNDFATAPGVNNVDAFPKISLADLRATNAVTVLPDGFTVRGIVTDEAGKPVAGATVKEGYGAGNVVRVSEFKTGADGRFEQPHRLPRQWIYTATAEGRATASVVADVGSNTPEVRVVLPAAQPLRVHVTDATGKPVANCKLTTYPYQNQGQILDWNGETDAGGVAVWTNAPVTPVSFYAASEAAGVARQFEACATNGVKTVVLDRNAGQHATVRIAAYDAKTHAPVNIRSVAVEYNGKFELKTLSEPNAPTAAIEINATDFAVGMGPEYKVQVNADGYEPFETDRFIDLPEGDQNLTVNLTAGGVADGVVLLPGGQPAAGTRIWVRPTENAGALFMNGSGHYWGDRLVRTNTAADGKFQLPPIAGNQPVVFVHPNGFLATTLDDLKQNHRAQLQAWGRVEGVLKVAGKPKRGVMVNLSTIQWSPNDGFNVSYSASSGPDGSFAFDQVPPGEYKLARTPAMRTGRAITEDHQMPLVVKPGETLKVDYSNAGRAIIGQAVADPPGAAVDWKNDDHTLTLKQPAIPSVQREDFATFKAFTEAYSASWKTPARMARARAARTYVLEFDPDGSFRAEDVPPGTYELNIRPTKPGQNQFRPEPNPQDELGSLTCEVVVPPGDGPLDLGTLTVTMKGGAAAEAKAPRVKLSVKTVDGKTVSLSDYQGRFVVLAFWAPWSDRSLEELKGLQKLETDLNNDPRVAILGVSIDGDPAAVAQEAESRGYHWTQATVDSAGLSRLATTFDVTALPAIYLIDRESHVLGRDLAGDHLVASVQRALQQK